MACVDLPAFPLQLLLRRHPEWKEYPVAVVEADKPQAMILWVNERARQCRILPGMRYAAGLSLARELRAGVVAEPDIEAARDELAERLRFYTPEVEPSRSEPGVFWLGAGGLEWLHGPLLRWAMLVQSDLLRHGYTLSIAVGFTRFGVYAAARAAGALEEAVGALEEEGSRHAARSGSPLLTLFADPEEERLLLRRIPIDRLGIDPGLRDMLARLGIHHLGGFLDLPAGEIRRRFGEEAQRLHRMASGEDSPAVRPEIPEDPWLRRVILDHPESDSGRLLVILERELSSLIADLAVRGRAISAVTLRLLLDRGGGGSETPGPQTGGRIQDSNERRAREEPDGRERVERLRPARPTIDLRQLLDLLRLRLEALSLPTGVVDLSIEAEGTVVGGEQVPLFQAARRDRAAAARALARIRAEFGAASVVASRPVEAHLPEARFAWDPVEEIRDASPRAVRVPPLVRRIHPTQPLSWPPRPVPPNAVHGHAVEGREGNTVLGGPYIVSGGWWRDAVHREYHYVRDPRGRILWVYYDERRRRWYRQGEVA